MPNDNMPKHVAIIMDGNGRWAKKRLFPRTAGHKAAVKSVRATIEFAVEKNIQILTLFAFGRENWLRPQEEVNTLMTLFSEVLVNEVAMMQDNNVRLHVVGDRSRLSNEVIHNISNAEKETAHCSGLKLNVAIDYSGQWEVLTAAKKLLQQLQSGVLKADEIDQISEENFNACLIKEIQTPVDLLIRTSGEKRISNFMIWQLSYAELYFCDKYWPDFSKKDFKLALDEYQKRTRRFGKTDEQMKGKV
ncbi:MULTISPECIES: polyprenyl diphosphate synthase [Cysteiniphilum]|uniref:polyprenyl diphosphate synthase n=1 Tax=Cysteiniphilum TaxID=2056696 RepID=UPI001784889D|nr:MULTISPECIES: polyprenyl diphosphate synthase [Cysteiniphilum]